MSGVLKWFADEAAGKAQVTEKLKSLPGAGGGGTEQIQHNIINYLLYAAGLLSVIMIIVAGVQMTTSAGDPGAVAKAKKTLTGAIVGLMISILAYAIVNFVIGRLV